MKAYYSILKYKHSLVLGEAVNVGVLFCFPAEIKIDFVSPPSAKQRLSIYPDFDIALYSGLINIIKNTCRQINENRFPFPPDFGFQMHRVVFGPQEAAGLVFDQPVEVEFSKTSQIFTESYSKLFLPYCIS